MSIVQCAYGVALRKRGWEICQGCGEYSETWRPEVHFRAPGALFSLRTALGLEVCDACLELECARVRLVAEDLSEGGSP